jgi:hypothetical protein
MTGSSGRRHHRAGSRTAGRAAGRRPRDISRSPAFDGRHTPVEIVPERREVGCRGGRQRPDHDEIRAQPGQLRPDRRAQPPLHAVPDDGVPDGPAHDDADPGRRVLPDSGHMHDEGTTRRTSSAHCRSELVRAAHSVDLGKHTTPVVRRRDECGPCGAVRRGSPCLRACASAAGTRASCCDGGCSVETYAYSRGLAPIFTVDRHGGRMVLGRVTPCCGAASAAAPELCCTTRMHTHDQRRRLADFPTVRGGYTRVKPARGCLIYRPGARRHATRRKDSPGSELYCALPVENVLSRTRSSC